MNIGERIKQRRILLGMSVDDLAAEVNKNRATIYRYERGDIENLPTTVLEPLAEALKTTPAYLIGWTDDPRNYENDPDIQVPSELIKEGWTAEDYAKRKEEADRSAYEEHMMASVGLRPAGKRRYRYLGKVACGEPIFADEQKETYVDLDSDVRADFVLEAKGDSMINARIYDGDIVFIREQPDVQDGELAVVIIDDEATLKRVYKYDDHISLFSENPKYKPIIVKANEGKTVRIIGKAIGAYITLN